MRPPVQIQVREPQLARLRAMYEETSCPRTRLRVQIVLLCHDSYSVEEIAKITRKSDDTVRYWLHRYQQGGCSGLVEGPHSGRPPEITTSIKTFLHECIPQSPRTFKMNRPGWTTALLAKLYRERSQNADLRNGGGTF
jgi:transposase